MKKFAVVLAALLFIGGLCTTGYISTVRAEDTAAKSVMCPTCNIEIPAGEKPVLSMLAGKSHTCPSCSKSYDIAADQQVHTCSACGGQVQACPACGKTELIPKA